MTWFNGKYQSDHDDLNILSIQTNDQDNTLNIIHLITNIT